MKLRAAALLLLIALPAAAHEADPGAALITPDALMATVADLCADEMAGRLPGTEGYRRAVEYAAARFAALGLEPGGEDGWYQHLVMESNVIRRAELVLTGADGAVVEPELGPEWACRGFTGSGDVDAGVVFVGYGLSYPELGYDDYAGVDVRGKLVLALKPAPPWALSEEEGFEPAHLPRGKMRTAREHGAAGLLLVGRPGDRWSGTVIASVLHGSGEHVPDLPAAQISVDDAGRLFAGGVEEYAAVLARLDERHAPDSRVLAGRAHLVVEADYEAGSAVENVVGVLPGVDPELSREVLVIGGHLDHVGAQAGVVWPGANDNASGAAAVLQLAEAFVKGGLVPRRTVVFVLFAGEEQGLLGAERYVAGPTRPLADTVAMFNLDCVAHGDSISLGGGETQPALWNLVRDLDRTHAGLSVARTWAGGGADAEPFHEAGVPTLYFASRFSYTHLHRTSDTVDTLAPELYAELVRLAYRGAVEVVQGRYAGEASRN